MLLSNPCPHCGTLAAPHDHPGRADWMPIGSAPKGRRDILVTLEGTALMAVAHHNPAVARPDSGGWFLYGRPWKPSHWLWLPAPLIAALVALCSLFHRYCPLRRIASHILHGGADLVVSAADWLNLV